MIGNSKDDELKFFVVDWTSPISLLTARRLGRDRQSESKKEREGEWETAHSVRLPCRGLGGTQKRLPRVVIGPTSALDEV